MAFFRPFFVAALDRAVMFGILALLVMQVIPASLAAGNPESGAVSQKIEVNGLTLFISAAYPRDWSWGQDNTVQVTISRLVGPSNSSVLIFYETAVLHRNGSSLVLANSQVSSSVPLHFRVGLAKPVDLSFSFSNESYTSDVQQGQVYPAHLAIVVDMLVINNQTTSVISFPANPGSFIVALNTERPGSHTQTDSFLYLAAAEIIGFGGIVFLVKAAKFGANQNSS